MKQFNTAARRGRSAVTNPADIDFEFEVREGEYVTMTAKAPTTGQLALFFGHQLDSGTGSVRAMFDLLSAVLDQRDYDIIEQQLHTGLDVEVVVEMVQYLVSEWAARPTTPPPGSSPSRRTTGSQSTAKQRNAASTTST
jgi:hypothetical protein